MNKKKTRKTRNVEPELRQVRAINNMLSGKFKHKGQAMLDAGYSESFSKEPCRLMRTKGVQIYLERLSKISTERWKMSLPNKVMTTYLDGLEATKLCGKDGIVHPDWQARKAFADRFSEFFGWSSLPVPSSSRFAQFNFFSVTEQERRKLNTNFKKFLQHYYTRQ